MKHKQAQLFKDLPKAYGGSLLKKAKARRHGRSITTKKSMHFILKSSQAKGAWSFTKHRAKIENILNKFARRYGVRLHSMANVGNHLHIHLHLTNRHAYNAFIRATTGAIMMAVTGVSRWKKWEEVIPRVNSNGGNIPLIKKAKKFWDWRPFSRVVTSLKDFLNVRDYIEINRIEGYGYTRADAKFFVSMRKQDNPNTC